MIPTATLRQRVTITPFSGHSAYGPVYGTAVQNVPARVVSKRRMVRQPDGVQVLADATCTIRPRTVVPESKVTMSDGRVYLVLDVLESRFLDRLVGLELILQGVR